MKFIILIVALIVSGCSGMSESVLSSEQQRDLKKEWRKKTPEEQEQMKSYYRRFKKLPLSEREDLKDKWQNLTPARKQYFIDRAKKLSKEEREKEADKFFSMPNRERLDYLEGE